MENTRKVALVTGAGKGIGHAIAVALAEAGYNIAVHYRSSQEEALETQKICENFGAEVLLLKADLTDYTACEEMIKKIKEHWGQVDVLVNNAGMTKDNLMMRMKPEDFESVIQTNLTSAFYLSKLCSSLMMKKRYGRIINISSISGVRGNAGQANYSASKAGLIGLTKTIAKELAGRNVTANAIAPGFITTDMTAALNEDIQEKIKAQIPLGRFGSPQDIANTVVFLCSEGGNYITGQVISVDGGLNI